MHIFIDESGDTGINGSKTKYFVISAIIFDDIYSLQKTQEEIELFKKNERIKDELHFCHKNNLIRDKFFSYIKNSSFTVKAISVNKEQLINEERLQNISDGLYKYTLKMLLDSLNTDKELKIIIDEKGNKNLERELKQYLKTNPKLKITKLITKDSKRDVLLQLADMVVSAIGHSYNKKDKPNSNRWKDMIASKINIWNFR